jgi:hypothetical protein
MIGLPDWQPAKSVSGDFQNARPPTSLASVQRLSDNPTPVAGSTERGLPPRTVDRKTRAIA